MVFNREKRNNRILAICAILSLVAHVSFMAAKFQLFQKVAIKKTPEEKRIKLTFRSQKDKKKLNKVVATEKSENSLNKDAEYLSSHNNSVARQTRAHNRGTTKKAGKGNSKVNSKQNFTKKVTKNTTKKMKKKAKRGAKKVSFKDFAFTKKTSEIKERQNRKKGIKTASANHRGLGSSNDILDEVPLGDMTQLNTKEFKYYGFYFRIRQRLEQHWGKSLKAKMEKLFKKGGRFPASDKHITAVKVIMDHKGKIVDVVLKSSSGVSELDEAAIEAFNNAGPFPNPPSGMIKDGKASVEWGFAVSS